MTSSLLLDRVHRGDRTALRALLQTHGAHLDAVLRAFGVNDDDAWRAAVVGVWDESMALVLMPGETAPDERAFVVAAALAAVARPLLDKSHLDKDVAARLAGRAAAGVAAASERALFEGQRAADPAHLGPVAAKMVAAASTSSSSSSSSGPGRTERLWASVEPLLR